METLFRIFEICVIPVVVASIGAMALIRSNRREIRNLDKRNTEQHYDNAALLQHLSNQVGGIDSKVDRLDERLDTVQTWQFEHEKDHLIKRDSLDI